MSKIAELLKSVAGLLILAGLTVVALVAIFVAWWIALAIVAAFAIYLAVRRLFPGKPKGDATIIEGEYRIEKHDD